MLNIEDYTVSPWERIHRKDGRHNGQDATQQVDSFQAPVKSWVCALIWCLSDIVI